MLVLIFILCLPIALFLAYIFQPIGEKSFPRKIVEIENSLCSSLYTCRFFCAIELHAGIDQVNRTIGALREHGYRGCACYDTDKGKATLIIVCFQVEPLPTLADIQAAAISDKFSQLARAQFLSRRMIETSDLANFHIAASNDENLHPLARAYHLQQYVALMNLAATYSEELSTLL